MSYSTLTIPAFTTADRAILKRCIGKPIAEAGRALGVFYAYRPTTVPNWQEESCFAVFCMSALWKDNERGSVLPMEECLRIIKSSESLDKRIMSLLDTNWLNGDSLLSTKLGRLIRQIYASGKNISPDFPQLFNDLNNWDSNNRFVQRKWAKTYFVKLDNNNANNNTLEEE